MKRRKDGLIEIKVSIGKNLDGSLKRKSFYGKTKKEALSKAEKYKSNLNQIPILENNIIFEEWANKYLEVYKKPFLKPSSFIIQKTIFEKHIIPYFGKAFIKDIKPAHIQEFFNRNRSFKKNYLSNIKVSLYSVFEQALNQEIIYKNPVEKIKINSTSSNTIKKVYNQEQVKKIIEIAKTHKYGLEIFILLKTGIRISELNALKWEDIDFNNNIVNIRRATSRGSEIKEFQVKTKNSIRSIPVDKEFLNFIKNLDRKGAYIFEKNGKLLEKITLQNRVSNFMKYLNENTNLEKLSPHELRHTYGTLLREKGVDLYTISKVMGHSDIKTTAGIYIHNDIEVLKKNMFLD